MIAASQSLWLDVLLVAAGIALLAGGGEALIRGALAIARRLGISPLLTGLVIVGFGTSMPELAVSVDATLAGTPDIAIGNVVGSNIGNILFILGLCAVITPLAVSPVALRRDSLVVIAASGLFVLVAWGGVVARLEGVLLLTLLATYVGWTYWQERAKAGPPAELHQQEGQAIEAVPHRWPVAVLLLVAGLGLLILGAQLLVQGAQSLAREAGLSEAAIGLTVVAIGTSLPELSVSVMAATRRQGDVAIGNILGSNIFNVLGILGVAAITSPLAVGERMASFDQWVMLGSAVLLLVFLATRRRLGRVEGGLLLVGYAGYVGASFLVM
ncbi:MAG: calcium/sodium antiporter [Thermoplasmatota archaeon]